MAKMFNNSTHWLSAPRDKNRAAAPRRDKAKKHMQDPIENIMALLLHAGLMPPVEVKQTEPVLNHCFVICVSLNETSLGLATSSNWHFKSLK